MGHALNDTVINRAAEAALEGAAPLSKNRYKMTMVKGILRRSLRSLTP